MIKFCCNQLLVIRTTVAAAVRNLLHDESRHGIEPGECTRARWNGHKRVCDIARPHPQLHAVFSLANLHFRGPSRPADSNDGRRAVK